ncbi:reverse transcriptase [Phytophthora megakarya]|uniref:Reverse transcriptase n=1 Tax=Phytophthora megakarya TaxID=4795 RepID=A0A225WBM2_9STRA|nr:reverse transcriptase [Phytophthora megakarya]
MNGVDIWICIDYRLVNNFIQMSSYPLPLIDGLLVGFALVHEPGYGQRVWAIKMTERSKLISAFVSPFGHFQWIRMPFGLKNAPLIYRQMINNCLLPPEEEAEVDQEFLDYLHLDPQSVMVVKTIILCDYCRL